MPTVESFSPLPSRSISLFPELEWGAIGTPVWNPGVPRELPSCQEGRPCSPHREKEASWKPWSGQGPKFCSTTLSIRSNQRLWEDALILAAEVCPCQNQKDGPVHPRSCLLSRSYLLPGMGASWDACPSVSSWAHSSNISRVSAWPEALSQGLGTSCDMGALAPEVGHG